MILAGDVGGTHVRLAVLAGGDFAFPRDSIRVFPSREFASLGEVIGAYTRDAGIEPLRAVIGVPGPVINGAAQATNLPWHVSESGLRRSLPKAKVRLVNDLVAITASVPYLAPPSLETLHAGTPSPEAEVFAVVAPGTGLGQGFLARRAGAFHPFASEAGHADFAPANARHGKLLHFLAGRFGHVSCERVISGQGLVNIFDYLHEVEQMQVPAALQARLAAADPAAVISQAALRHDFAICEQALHIFVEALGAQAGNMVLTLLATGGVYLAGGIPPKIIDKLRDGTLVRNYLNKGRLSPLLARTPLHVVLDEFAGLLGAAALARELA